MENFFSFFGKGAGFWRGFEFGLLSKSASFTEVFGILTRYLTALVTKGREHIFLGRLFHVSCHQSIENMNYQ